MVVYELCSLNLRLRALISGNLPDPWAPKIAIRGFLNRGGQLMERLSGQPQVVLKPTILVALISILVLSFILNVWGNKWGAPEYWHPDELTGHAAGMASRRTLNPHVFPYGGLHYNVVLAGAIIPEKIFTYYFDPRPDAADEAATLSWKNRHHTLRIILARTISGLFATALVLITFLMGKILFNERAGLLAALFLAVSPYFVGIAHFATVDMPGNFWFWLSCLFGLLVWKRGHNIWYALAAVAAGFAIGTKVDRLVVVLPLLLSHLLRGEGLKLRKLALFGLVIPGGYILANPTLIFSFFEFVDGTARDLFFNIVRGEPGQTSYLRLIDDIMSGMGAPLFLAAVGGLCYAVYNFVSGVDRAQTAWLLTVITPYYFIFGSRLSTPWYVPIFFPALTLFAAYGCNRIFQLIGRRPIIAGLIVTAIAGPSFLYSLAMDLQLSNDARHLAAKWIERNVPVNSTVEISPNGPVIARDQYQVTYLPRDPANYEFARKWRDRLAAHEGYQSIRNGILSFEQWLSEEYGLQQRNKPYKAWFDKVPGVVADPESAEIDIDSETETEPPDYIVRHGKRIKPPGQDYELVAEFKYRSPFGLQTQLPFVNPSVHVYQFNSRL